MNALQQRLTGILDESRRTNRLRTLDALESAQGREIIVDKQSFVNFSSNDYLGLSSHNELILAAAAGAKRHGVGSGASALLSGRSTVHQELETKLAAYMGRERALLFSSGYLANLGVINALVKRSDHIFSDELNHASLIDAIALSKAQYTRYPHLNIRALESAVQKCDNPQKWIVTDTLFSMDGDVAPLQEIAILATRYNATLIGDDAHGFGVLDHGRGAAAACGLNQQQMPVQIVTFGKALGTAGAAVLGSDDLINAIIQRGRTFIYDTAPPPMIAAATLAALHIVSTDTSVHESLASNIARFRDRCKNLPILQSDTPIQPVMVGLEADALKVAQSLRDAGFYVRAIRPPTVPEGTARLRICLSSGHNHDDIDALAAAMEIAFDQIVKRTK